MSTWLYFWFQSVITQLDYLSMKETTFINRFEMPQRRTFRLFLCVCICYVNDSLNFQSVDSIGPSSTFTERQLGKKTKKQPNISLSFSTSLMGVFLSQIKVLLLLYMNELCLNYRPPLYLLPRKSHITRGFFLLCFLHTWDTTPENSILWINDGTIQGCISRTAIHISDALIVCSWRLHIGRECQQWKWWMLWQIGLMGCDVVECVSSSFARRPFCLFPLSFHIKNQRVFYE